MTVVVAGAFVSGALTAAALYEVTAGARGYARLYAGFALAAFLPTCVVAWLLS